MGQKLCQFSNYRGIEGDCEIVIGEYGNIEAVKITGCPFYERFGGGCNQRRRVFHRLGHEGQVVFCKGARVTLEYVDEDNSSRRRVDLSPLCGMEVESEEWQKDFEEKPYYEVVYPPFSGWGSL